MQLPAIYYRQNNEKKSNAVEVTYLPHIPEEDNELEFESEERQQVVDCKLKAVSVDIEQNGEKKTDLINETVEWKENREIEEEILNSFQNTHISENEEISATHMLNCSLSTESNYSNCSTHENSPYYLELEEGTVVAMVDANMEPIHLKLFSVIKEIEELQEKMLSLESIHSFSEECHSNRISQSINEQSTKLNCYIYNERNTYNYKCIAEEINSNTQNTARNEVNVFDLDSTSNNVYEELSAPTQSEIDRETKRENEYETILSLENVNDRKLEKVSGSCELSVNKELVLEAEENEIWQEVSSQKEYKKRQEESEKYELTLAQSTEANTVNEVKEEIYGNCNYSLSQIVRKERILYNYYTTKLASLYKERGVLLREIDKLLKEHAQENERWESNEVREECYNCHRIFGVLKRRHHCRRCGKLCCAECSRFFGKKQNTFYQPYDILTNKFKKRKAKYNGSNVCRSEYSARMTANDKREERLKLNDEYTYPRPFTRNEFSNINLKAGIPKITDSKTFSENRKTCTKRAEELGFDKWTDLNDPGVIELEEEMVKQELEKRNKQKIHSNGISKRNKWVRICSVCYTNCLRARKTDVIKRIHNANEYVLDDGLFYFFVLTEEELRSFTTFYNKPDSVQKQLELESTAIVERAVDYLKEIPTRGVNTMSKIIKTSPQVIRTIGYLSQYATRKITNKTKNFVNHNLKKR